MQIRVPREITETAASAGAAKASLTVNSTGRLLTAACLAGAYIALGGILSLVVGFGYPEITGGNPSMQKLLSGCMFPIGLILVVVLGAELFTGNNALLIPSYMKREHSMATVVRNWTLVYIGNFIGALLFTWLMVYACGLTSAEPYHSAITGIAKAKESMPWLTVLLKGIGANWCVCLAVWLALAGKTFFEKALGCWLPVMAFVVLGYEHSIANMFFIPLGMMEGAEIGIGEAVWRNLIPATIGNIIGGALLVGTVYGYLHGIRRK